MVRCEECAAEFVAAGVAGPARCPACTAATVGSGRCDTVPMTRAAAAPAARPPRGDRIGTIVEGCRIVSLLGSGAMGDVYLGHEDFADRDVAVKVLRPELLEHGEAARARFRNEVRAVGRVRSAHVVQLYDSGELSDGGLYMKMEYVPGCNLGARIDPERVGDFAQVLGWVEQAARGLDDAERAGIVHRDVKPANLLLRTDGTVLVADFGIALLADVRSRLTQRDVLLGTVLYMSPEQFAGEPATVRSDVYSLGATFFHLLTGRPPVGGRTLPEVMREKRSAGALSLRGRVPDDASAPWWHAAETLLQRMTARAPARRPASFAAVLTAIAAARRAAGAGRRRGWRRSARAAATAAALVGAGLVALAIATTARRSAAPRGRPPAAPAAAVAEAEPAPRSPRNEQPPAAGPSAAAAPSTPSAAPAPPAPAASAEVPDGAAPAAASDGGPRAPAADPVVPAEPRGTEPIGARGERAAAAARVVAAATAAAADAAEPAPPGSVAAPPALMALRAWADWASDEPAVHDGDGIAWPVRVVDRRRRAAMRLVAWAPAGTWFYADVDEVAWRQWDQLGIARPDGLTGDDAVLPVRGVSRREIGAFLAVVGGGLTLPDRAQWSLLAFGPPGREWPWGDGAPAGAFRFALWNGERVDGLAALQRADGDGERSPEGFRFLVGNVREVVRGDGAAADAVVGVGFDEQLFPSRFRRLAVRVTPFAGPAPNVGFRCVRSLR